ncbi:MAG: magnesium transporter [Leptospirales bacterium]|nr:magnesium transporter [Leptospirales bacterium]
MEGEVQQAQPETDPELVFLHRDEQDWKDHVLQLFHDGAREELRRYFDELYPADIAHLIEGLAYEEGAGLLSLLDAESQGRVLSEIDPDLRDRLLRESMDNDALSGVLLTLPSDIAAELLQSFKQERVSEILSRMPHQERLQITELLSYPENTAGAIMEKEFLAVEENDTIKKAIARLRKVARDGDEIYTVFVVDDQGRYCGHLSLKQLILARPQQRVKRIMQTELSAIPALTDQEEVARFFTRYDFISAPVIDNRGVMLGRITADDVLEVVEEEASEDILRMGGLSGEETLSTPLWRSSLRRVGWLVVNLATAVLAASVVALFEQTLQKVITLAAFLPIVAGMGGNAAGQTMALIIRNIALGEITQQNALRTLRREAVIGLLNGLSVGLVVAMVVLLYSGVWILAAIMFTAILCNMLVAAAAGAAAPMALRRLKIDPAVASNIIVTTFTDTAGFLAVLGLSYLALRSGWIPL